MASSFLDRAVLSALIMAGGAQLDGRTPRAAVLAAIGPAPEEVAILGPVIDRLLDAGAIVVQEGEDSPARAHARASDLSIKYAVCLRQPAGSLTKPQTIDDDDDGQTADRQIVQPADRQPAQSADRQIVQPADRRALLPTDREHEQPAASTGSAREAVLATARKLANLFAKSDPRFAEPPAPRTPSSSPLVVDRMRRERRHYAGHVLAIAECVHEGDDPAASFSALVKGAGEMDLSAARYPWAVLDACALQLIRDNAHRVKAARTGPTVAEVTGQIDRAAERGDATRLGELLDLRQLLIAG